MLVILDYGINNLRSVQKAFESQNIEAVVQKNLTGATRLVIPGIGAFGTAMANLEVVKADILAFAKEGNPILGICLGQQLLFDSSEERGETEGLGLISGKVKYLPKLSGIKIPHVGWNSLEYVNKSDSKAGFEGNSGEQVYFVHSLYTECANPDDIIATSEHGIKFPAMVRSQNIWGCQFHPEKSGAVGMRILRAFSNSELPK